MHFLEFRHDVDVGLAGGQSPQAMQEVPSLVSVLYSACARESSW